MQPALRYGFDYKWKQRCRCEQFYTPSKSWDPRSQDYQNATIPGLTWDRDPFTLNKDSRLLHGVKKLK